MMQRGVVSVGKLWYRWRSVTVNSGKADAVARKLGVTNGGFIYSVIPWAGTAVLMILVVPLAMRKLNA